MVPEPLPSHPADPLEESEGEALEEEDGAGLVPAASGWQGQSAKSRGQSGGAFCSSHVQDDGGLLARPSGQELGSGASPRRRRRWYGASLVGFSQGGGTPRHDDLREALLTSPADISSVIERLMQEDMASSAPGVGVAQQTSARAWLEHRSRVGPFAMNLAWSAAGALDALKAGLVEQARARLNVMLMVIDQMSVDRGSWTLAQELTLDLPPPVQAFKLREHASSSSAGQAYSRLLDSRWAEVSLTHLREQMVSQSAGSSFKRGRLPTRTKRLRPRPEKEPQPPPGGRQESRRSSDPEQLHASALAC